MSDCLPDSVSGDESDLLWPEACEALREMTVPGISGLQRRLHCGFNRAARFVETFERIGIVSAPDCNNAGIRSFTDKAIPAPPIGIERRHRRLIDRVEQIAALAAGIEGLGSEAIARRLREAIARSAP